MEFTKKDFASETAESFTVQKSVLVQKPHIQNYPYFSQIQQLLSILISKKAEYKQAKIKKSNHLQKTQQQDLRINKIKVHLQNLIQKQTILVNQHQKLQYQIHSSRQSIKQFNKLVKNNKKQLTQLLQALIQAKKSKADIDDVCAELECLIRQKKIQFSKLDQQVQNLQTLIISSQNDVRAKQDELTRLQLQKTELVALLDYLQQRLKLAVRARNSALSQISSVTQQLTKSQQKAHNIQKQTTQIEWNSQQLKNQNDQIQLLNQKLILDLDAVKKHLITLDKVNHLLKNSLAQYGITGDKVNRIIQSAKVY